MSRKLTKDNIFNKIVNSAESIDYLMCIKSYSGVHSLFPTLRIVPHKYTAGKAYPRNSIYYKEGHWRLPIRKR